MIELLASPSVCVIDDEKEEYEVILGALNRLCVPAHHIKGTDLRELPSEPFRSIRLVFQDLHLDGAVGKTAASRAANFFLKTVHPESAPVVVVIWSKHVDERVVEEGEPEEDQPTVSELFKTEVLGANDAYKSRLIFIEMKKPQPGDRPADSVEWTDQLTTEIKAKLESAPATGLLWEWESLVKAAAVRVVAQLVSFSASASTEKMPQDEGMKALLGTLASAQAEGDMDDQTAPRHVAGALSQLLADQLDHETLSPQFLAHGAWLSTTPLPPPATTVSLNGLLVTAECNTDGTPYAPGNVYLVNNEDSFKLLFDEPFDALKGECIGGDEAAKKACTECAVPVFVELSPVCDVAQGKRNTATLVAGLVVRASHMKIVKNNGAFNVMPKFSLRKAGGGFAVGDEVVVVICSKYRATLPSKTERAGLERWFRFRELPTAAMRTWLASQIARIGFVSL